VTKTPTHGVLVSVSAVMYIQILVSDRIGTCLYRPFSTHNRSFRRWIHPGSLVHLLFSSGWPAT